MHRSENYDKKLCWICNRNLANTGEHSIKNSVLKFLFGRGAQRLVKKKKSKKIHIQSTNSKHLKYDVICEDCNTNFTSSYDRAHDKLFFYIVNNIDSIIKKPSIDLTKVFKNKEEIKDCYRYFVKVFGCGLYSGKIKLPSDIVACIRKKLSQANLD